MANTRNNGSANIRINALSGLLLQLITVVAGIVLPRLILSAYGSAINGLVSSITQFISYITLMEAGVGSVMRTAMYKPLVSGDNRKLSAVFNASSKFFRGIACVFAVYLLLLAVAYPLLPNNEIFDYGFVFWLVLILGINTLAQYVFDLNQIYLLQADQKLYLVQFGQIASTVANVAISAVLITLGAGIHTVKLVTALMLLLRPVFMFFYVKKNYTINRKEPLDESAVSQRWDGMAHQVAYYVHRNTDAVLLTFFRTYQEVSVYAVYNMVVNALQMALSSVSHTFNARFGNLFAQNDKEELARSFSRYETWNFAIATVLFSVASILIVPFVGVYTQGISDANYIQNTFAVLLVLAEFFYAIRMPYSTLAFSAGEFKQTKIGSYIEAGMNIGLSLALVWWLGLVGVAIGTLIAMIYRTFDYAIYLSKHVLCRPLKYFIKNLALNLGVYVGANILCQVFILPMFAIDDFFTWTLCAVVTTLATGAILAVVHLLFNRKAFFDSFKLFF